VTLPSETMAVVVGIEEYQTGIAWRLDGPALDACRFARWLCTRGVPADRVTLLVSPQPANAAEVTTQAADFRSMPAEHGTIRDVFTRYLPRHMSDLLIVYWGGHGVIEQEERRLLYADATILDKRNLNLSSLLTAMRSSTFVGHPRQICLVDACQNLVVELGWEGSMPDEGFAIGRPEPQRDQYVLLAASPGERAINVDGLKTGLFSQVLREGFDDLPVGTWPPDMDRLRNFVNERFELLRSQGRTEQVPSSLWFRSRSGDDSQLFPFGRPAGRFVQDEQNRRQRALLLSRLQKDYTADLRQSLEQTVRLDLDLDLTEAKISRRRSQVVLLPVTEQEKPLPKGTSLLQVFDEEARGLVGRGLLVLGSPGSGKTTMLIELAQQLTARALADHESAHPTPIYLPLSAWAIRRPPLTEWLVEQLDELYEVPRDLGRRWMEPRNGALLFLLDGLDEITQLDERDSCIREINRFRRSYQVPVIVATCQAEYDAASTKLELETAVSVRPLNPERVLDHLQQAGPQTHQIVESLQRDKDLRDLLRSPLLVSILTLAYAGKRASVPAVTAHSPAERRQILMSDYVDRRFELGRTADTRTNQERSLRYLTALAANLTHGRQTMLLVGRLRSDWLPSPLARRVVIIVPKLALGFSTGVVHWWVNAMAVRSGFASVPTFHLVINIAFGLVVGLAERLRAIVRVSAWMVYGSIAGVVNVKLMPVDGPVSAAAHILYFVIIFVIAGELVVRFLGGELEPVERLSFSWERARLYLPKASVRGLGVGLLLSLIIGLSAWPPGISWTDALIFGLIYGLIFGVVWGLIQGLARGASSAPIPTHVTPNEEIRRSARNGLIVGPTVGTVVGLLFLLGGGLAGVLRDSPAMGLTAGLFLGLAWGLSAMVFFGLVSGLGAVVQHAILRLLLWGYRIAPLRYVRWLNKMVRLRLLYWGVGGGYRFIHGTVQDYFAPS
jgi:NACHT domain/Caspase domain